ncbi:MAG: sigma-70 family RNA polymerase sigma factor [Bacteroidota bacterium]|nr:sigma-70 family RNA polymerase sigma factor [Bacteroidota bacterium]
MSKTKIENIVFLCQKGDKQAQKTLFELYAHKMMFVCKRYFSSEEDCSDVFMEGFMKVFLAIDKYKFTDEKSFSLWVRKIIINHCLNTLKKNNRLLLLDKQMQEEVLEANKEQSKEYFQSQFTQEEIFGCLDKLPKNLKTVFNMLVIDEFSQKEVAQRLETTEGVIKVYAHRARQILKQELEKILNNRQSK